MAVQSQNGRLFTACLPNQRCCVDKRVTRTEMPWWPTTEKTLSALRMVHICDRIQQHVLSIRLRGGDQVGIEPAS